MAGIGEMVAATPACGAGFLPGVIAGGLAARFGASNVVAGFTAIGVFLTTFVGVCVWGISRASRAPHPD